MDKNLEFVNSLISQMTIKEKIALFPHQSGVYRYYDADGNIIYVGKAKDLHKRVAQYFVPKERLTRKTAIMVSKIADAQYSVVESEADALYRARNVAGPLNARRLHRNTPCAIRADKCYDCDSPDRICRGLSVLWRKPAMSDIEILLIDADLGY